MATDCPPYPDGQMGDGRLLVMRSSQETAVLSEKRDRTKLSPFPDRKFFGPPGTLSGKAIEDEWLGCWAQLVEAIRTA